RVFLALQVPVARMIRAPLREPVELLLDPRQDEGDEWVLLLSDRAVPVVGLPVRAQDRLRTVTALADSRIPLGDPIPKGGCGVPLEKEGAGLVGAVLRVELDRLEISIAALVRSA